MKEQQYDLIHKNDWATLIILDACRYDKFCEVYSGKCSAVTSPAGATHVWLQRMFKTYYPCTIYSGHLGINSLDFEVYGYRARDHFIEVKDVWRDSWDNIIGGSHPQQLNNAVLQDIEKGDFKGKNILWYMQPHFPWLGKTRIPLKEFEDRGVMEWDREAYGDLKEGKYDKDFVNKAYTDNIRFVMDYVNEVVDKLKGKVIITSDHGELLMDKGLPKYKQFGHFQDMHSQRKELREVPWVEINNG